MKLVTYRSKRKFKMAHRAFLRSKKYGNPQIVMSTAEGIDFFRFRINNNGGEATQIHTYQTKPNAKPSIQ